ncbi:hypothetical protein FACS1894137_13700 [Spirochaetia bacterium]|nr:hypothetical protein FACS1894137_13700 [Spirochaetia bacterium]
MVEIPANHRLTLEIPLEIPAGRGILTFTPTSAAEPSVSPAMEALKKEAAQKAARRFADPSGDALQRFCGSLAHIYTEDGVVIQRKMRNEWER